MSDAKPIPSQPVPTNSKTYKPAHGGYAGVVALDAEQAKAINKLERMLMFCYRYGTSAKKLGAL